ncbi:hypothetical protein Aperf_G00000034947 [Anoplocephala perfoliata]
MVGGPVFYLIGGSDELVSSKITGRKRAKLDHLTEEQKACRRKCLNRVAAQKARDRKKEYHSQLEKRIQALESENERIKQSIIRYKSGCEQRDRLIESLRSQITQLLNGQSRDSVQNQPIKSASDHPQLTDSFDCDHTYYDVGVANICSEITVSSFPSPKETWKVEDLSIDEASPLEDFKFLLDMDLGSFDIDSPPLSPASIGEAVEDFLSSSSSDNI